MQTVKAPTPIAAALAVMFACSMLAGMDAISKHVQQSLPALEVVWARFFFHLLIMIGAAMVLHRQRDLLHPRRPLLQFVRSALLMFVTISFYLAIREVSLADAAAVQFTAPILVTLLAAVLLNESINWQKLLAVALGFIGSLIIIRPGSENYNPQILLAGLSAISMAGYFIMTRYLSRHDHVLTTIFYSPIAGATLLLLILPMVWVAPTTNEWLQLMMMGTLGASGHLLLTWAFHHADASVLSPLLNSQLVAAAFFSAWLFSDRLEIWFYMGAGLIVSAGLLVSQRRKN